MDALTSTIRSCDVQLKLDNSTEGYGNCFPNAIIQQCRRPEIKAWLQENNPSAIVTSHNALRQKVKTYALQSTHKTLLEYKTNFETLIPERDSSWMNYWIKMGKDGTWVDSTFVQVTSWFMGLDILILTTSSKPDHPFMKIRGSLSGNSEPSAGPPLFLGYYTNVHYQSLLPTNMKQDSNSEGSFKEDNSKTEEKQDEFIYVHRGEQIIFQSLQNEKLQCPFCHVVFQRIVNHIASKKCNISSLKIETEEFTSQLKSYREGFRLEVGRRQKLKSRAKLIGEKGHETIKENENKRKQRSSERLIAERGKAAIKKDQVEHKVKSQDKLTVESGKAVIKKDQVERKVKSRDKLTAERGKEAVRKYQVEQKVKSVEKFMKIR